MKRLLAISLALVLLVAGICRAGNEFCTTVYCFLVGDTNIVNVPKGYELVIRQISYLDYSGVCSDPNRWDIDVDGSLLLSGELIGNPDGQYSHNFPDGCVVVSQYHILQLRLNYAGAEQCGSGPFILNVVGYFRPYKKPVVRSAN